MNTTPNAGLSHPLVVAYLDDLERALSSADQQERVDTLASVREHLTDALAGDAEPTTKQVRAVLDELGSVEQIAAAATPAVATPAVATPAAATPSSPLRASTLPASTAPSSTAPAETKQERAWVAPALLAASIVSLVIPVFGALMAIGCIVTAVVLLRTGAPRRNFLHGSIAVSIVALIINAVLVLGSLALFTARSEVSTVSGGPVPSIASYAPAP